MDIRELNGKTICVLGYGREGKAMVEALEEFAPECAITIADQNEELRIMNYELRLGEHWLDDLDQFDVIIKSPGIPPNNRITSNGSRVTNSTQIFLDSVNENATVIGITGSKGKSTTASLIHHILKHAGKDVHLVGNIGIPAIGSLSQLSTFNSQLFIVIELSSYQLMQVKTSPHIAVVTAFFPEHLDYHGNIENYKEAKMHICKHQKKDDYVFYDADSEGAKEIAHTSPGAIIRYEESGSPITITDTKLIGAHNLKNIAAAASVARHLGIDDATIKEVVKTFEGLPHRLNDIGVHHDIRWVDDAISTTPESTIAAIKALGDDLKTIILGGQDRGSDFTELGNVIDTSSIETVIVMGESRSRIAQSISKKNIHHAKSMKEAVSITKKQSTIYNLQSTICLLSPASPSYDMFKSFEEKGNLFQSLITDH